MGADNYENLGFQVKIDGAIDAVNHLDNIISRLERIKKLQNGSGNGHSKYKKGGVATDKQIFQEDVETAKQKGSRKAYTNLLNSISKEEQLNHIYAEQIETYKQLLSLKEKMFSYNVSTRNDVQTLTVATGTAKAQAEAQQLANNLKNESFIKAQQELAVEKEKLRVLKKQAVEEERLKQNPPLTEEEKLRASFEKSKRRREFGIQEGYIQEKQSLSEIEKYLQKVNQEKDLLNSKTYEEARRIELANQQRKKEIDQRLKQELGIKKTTKSLTAYLAKLSSGVMVARRLGRFVSGAIQESAAYTENLVLFSTAFGKSTEEQLKWALGLADAYGLARNEVVKFAGTFRELASSLGIVGETAENVTRIVTNLGYDLSALYNTSVEKAMEKLQSGVFTGQTKPLRYFGVDISQESINRLFETNEALAGLGVNARNLSQSDKVLARLLITINGARNSFGTMATEINNLQSQFRIFQGSLSNFKLAIGNLVQEPLKNAMININGFIIALTNIINAFSPKREEEKTIFDDTTQGAEEASKAIDTLNEKLAGFDKFNVLGQGGDSSSNLAVTEQLNKLLAEQARLYEEEVAKAMEKVKNQAVQVSKGIVGWFIEVDKEGNILYKDDMPIWTDNAKALGAGLAVLGGILAFKMIGSIGKFVVSLFSVKNAMVSISTILAGTLIYSIIKAVEAFRDGDEATGILATSIGVLSGAVLTYIAVKKIEDIVNKQSTSSLLLTAIAYNKVRIAAAGLAVAGIGLLVSNVANLVSNWDELSNLQRVVGVFGAIGAAALTAAAAVAAFHNAWTVGTASVAIIGGLAAIIGAFATFKSQAKDLGELTKSAHADGGYTNANLIMTHENGKREWVGKAAGSSAIVNDTQMSDIMEVAVAKGVYNALSARSAMGGNVPTNETIVVKIGEEAVFNAVRKTARRQGRDFANV